MSKDSATYAILAIAKTSIVCALVLASSLVFGQQLNTCDEVVYTAHPKYPPFHWAQDDRIVGLSNDIAQSIFQRLGIKARSAHVGPWKRVLKEAKNGNIDLVLGLKNTPERQTYLSFTTTPLLDNPVSVFVAKGKTFPFKGWEDLIARHGVLNAGDRFGPQFDQFVTSNLSIQRIHGLEPSFRMLTLGRADYFITGKYPGQAFLRTSDLKDKIETLSHDVLDGQIDFGFVTSSPCAKYITAFEQELLKLYQQRHTQNLFDKYWGLWLDSQDVLISVHPDYPLTIPARDFTPYRLE